MSGVVHSNPWFAVTRTEVGAQTWYRVKRPDSAMVIGRTADGSFLMVAGRRDTTGDAILYEFPCGVIEAGEDPRDAAVRETREETGYEVAALVRVGAFVESPGISTARCHIYSASVADAGGPELEAGEAWTTAIVSPSDLSDLVARGMIQDAGSLAALTLHRITER